MTYGDRSTVYNTMVPPAELTHAPLPGQIPYLDPLLHAAEPDVEDFVNRLCIENWSGL